MRARLKFLLVIFLAVCLLMGAVQAVRASQTASAGIGWWVLSAGGGPSSGGAVTLNATLGQPFVGTTTNGAVRLNAGYWVAAASGTVIYLPVIRK
jgi:hypothetical protein